MGPLDFVHLTEIMRLSEGNPNIKIGMIDGPVRRDHPMLSGDHIQDCTKVSETGCSCIDSVACEHGTFVAGILSAKRDSGVPGICPKCSLLVCSIFPENITGTAEGETTSGASCEKLTEAIAYFIHAGVHLINLSLSLNRNGFKKEHDLKDVVDYAVAKGIIIVAAAGNEGILSSSVLTGHPGVIPVVACDLNGRAVSGSNLGVSMAKTGLCAPGQKITGLRAAGGLKVFSGTSTAVPFVTGTMALLWSIFPSASGEALNFALTQHAKNRRSLVPPVLNAASSFEYLYRHS